MPLQLVDRTKQTLRAFRAEYSWGRSARRNWPGPEISMPKDGKSERWRVAKKKIKKNLDTAMNLSRIHI